MARPEWVKLLLLPRLTIFQLLGAFVIASSQAVVAQTPTSNSPFDLKLEFKPLLDFQALYQKRLESIRDTLKVQAIGATGSAKQSLNDSIFRVEEELAGYQSGKHTEPLTSSDDELRKAQRIYKDKIDDLETHLVKRAKELAATNPANGAKMADAIIQYFPDSQTMGEHAKEGDTLPSASVSRAQTREIEARFVGKMWRFLENGQTYDYYFRRDGTVTRLMKQDKGQSIKLSYIWKFDDDLAVSVTPQGNSSPKWFWFDANGKCEFAQSSKKAPRFALDLVPNAKDPDRGR